MKNANKRPTDAYLTEPLEIEQRAGSISYQSDSFIIHSKSVAKERSVPPHGAMASPIAERSAEQPSRSSQAIRVFLTALEVIADFATAVLAINLSYLLAAWHSTRSITLAQLSWEQERIAALVGILLLLLLKSDGAYRGGISLLKIRETERSLRASTQAWCLLIPLSLLFGVAVSRSVLACALVVLPICQAVQKQLVIRGVKWMHARGLGVQRTIVYGAGETGRRLLSALWSAPKLGWRPILVIDDNPLLNGQRLPGLGYRRTDVASIAEGPITRDLLVENRCDLLIIAVPRLAQEKFEMALEAAQEAHVRVAVLSDRSLPVNDGLETVDVDGLFIMCIDTPQATGQYDFAKRLFDFFGAAILLILLSPLMLVIAILIQLESKGGAFFKQERVGKQGTRFQMWKFRSMYNHVPSYEVSPTTRTDERITRVGRLIRKVSLDELPQLLNVLAGDMSLVGPRPEMPFLVDQYNSFQRQRLEVIPGITGLWQLSADRAFHIHENIQYDMYYIRNRGFFLDLAILFHTIIFAVRGI